MSKIIEKTKENSQTRILKTFYNMPFTNIIKCESKYMSELKIIYTIHFSSLFNKIISILEKKNESNLI